jgi:hypothetical protein
MDIKITNTKIEKVGPFEMGGQFNGSYGVTLAIQTDKTGNKWINIESLLITAGQSEQWCQERCLEKKQSINGISGDIVELAPVIGGLWFKVRDCIMVALGVELEPRQPQPADVNYIPKRVEELAKIHQEIFKKHGLSSLYYFQLQEWVEQYNAWLDRNPIAKEFGYAQHAPESIPDWVLA